MEMGRKIGNKVGKQLSGGFASSKYDFNFARYAMS